MEKRMVIAVGLSLLILFGFQLISPKPSQNKIATTYNKNTYTQNTEKEKLFEDKVKAKDIEQSRDPENTVTIRNGVTELVFSDLGANLKEISVYEQTGKADVKERIYFQQQLENRIFTLNLPILNGIETAKFEIKEGPGFVEFTRIEENWLKVTKTYTYGQNDHAVKMEVKIENLSQGKKEIEYSLSGPGGIQENGSVSGRSFLEANVLMDGKIWKASKVKGPQERKGLAEWAAVKNRYYGIILKPEISTKSATIKEDTPGSLMTELSFGAWTIAPGAEIRQEYILYAGPLNEKEIAKVSKDMTSAVNYGFFGGVSKALLVVLRFFFGLTHNWGVAIILLTISVNLLLFPLAVKSFVSMHQMKKIQPHIMKLKELHKDNPQKLNKETMELYKKNNVNPLGGCLPLLLQMPIFIALYQGLIRSIELKGASFLWIKDLAKPDAVPLPFKLPVIGNSINILPLMMVAMMALQQKFTQTAAAKDMTEDQKSQQKMMMLMMPVIFGFMFYGMPSGLVLYWLTNTILMTTGQKIISVRLEEEK